MGACVSKKPSRKNNYIYKSKYDDTSEADKNGINYNTNNTKHLNLSYSIKEENKSQCDIKLGLAKIYNQEGKDPQENSKPQNKTDESNKKKITFLPHIYNSLTIEEIKIFKILLEIQKSSNLFNHSIYTLDDLMIQISMTNKNILEDEYEKLKICWKIFNWILLNIKCIEYKDKIIIESELDKEFSIESIFINRQTNSYGIARLFKYIMDMLNISSVIVSGYLKLNNHMEGRKFSHINHFWNAIEFYGQLRLVDCTCGGETLPNVKSETEIPNDIPIKFFQFYFCAIPQHLIYTHFPQNLDHSGLKNVQVLMDLDTFENLKIFNRFFFIYGFQLFDHKNADVNYEELVLDDIIERRHLNEFNLEFCLPKNIFPKFNLMLDDTVYEKNILNQLVHIKRRNFNIEEDRKKISMIDYYFYYDSFISKSSKYNDVLEILDDFIVYEVCIRLFQQGKYKVSLSAGLVDDLNNGDIRGEDTLGKFDNCFNYKINADFKGLKQYSIEEIMFPMTTDSFINYNCVINEPLFYHLESYFVNKKNIDFNVRLPGAIDAAVFYDTEDEFDIMNKKEDDTFTFCHNIEKLFGKINIAANFGDNEYVILITYEF